MGDNTNPREKKSREVATLLKTGSSRFMDEIIKTYMPESGPTAGHRFRSSSQLDPRANLVQKDHATSKDDPSEQQLARKMNSERIPKRQPLKSSRMKPLTDGQKAIMKNFLREVRENLGKFGEIGSELWMKKMANYIAEKDDTAVTKADVQYWVSNCPKISKRVDDMRRMQMKMEIMAAARSGKLDPVVILSRLSSTVLRKYSRASTSTDNISHSEESSSSQPPQSEASRPSAPALIPGGGEIYIMNDNGQWDEIPVRGDDNWTRSSGGQRNATSAPPLQSGCREVFVKDKEGRWVKVVIGMGPGSNRRTTSPTPPSQSENTEVYRINNEGQRIVAGVPEARQLPEAANGIQTMVSNSGKETSPQTANVTGGTTTTDVNEPPPGASYRMEMERNNGLRSNDGASFQLPQQNVDGRNNVLQVMQQQLEQMVITYGVMNQVVGLDPAHSMAFAGRLYEAICIIENMIAQNNSQ